MKPGSKFEEFNAISDTQGNRMTRVKDCHIEVLQKKGLLVTCPTCCDFHPAEKVEWAQVTAEITRLKMN